MIVQYLLGMTSLWSYLVECTSKRYGCLTIDCTLDGDDVNRLEA